jgi:hypothetical protein
MARRAVPHTGHHPMTHTSPAASTLTARAAAATGLTAAAAFMAWRAFASWNGSVVVANAALLFVQAMGLAGAALLVWALWPAPALAEAAIVSDDACVDVFVRTHGRFRHEAVATVESARRLHGLGRITLVAPPGEPSSWDGVASELGVALQRAPFVATFLRASRWSTQRTFLVLDAGDVIDPEAAIRMARSLADPRVAAVQAGTAIIGIDDDSHGPNGLEIDAFHRHTLNRALARRGGAIITTSGVLVRRGAMESLVGPADEADPASAMELSLRLVRAGWRVEHTSGPALVVRHARHDERASAVSRQAVTRAAWALAFGREGALRTRGLPLRQRTALLSWTALPLSGVHVIATLAVLVTCLMGGYVPFAAEPLPVLALWLPSFVLIPLALAMLSGWALRPGDRTRLGMRHLGPTIGALLRTRPSDTSASSAWIVGAIGVLAVAVGVRTVSERATSALGELPADVLQGMLLVGLWTLAMACDSLRLLNRRGGARRTPRVATSFPASLGGLPVMLVDLAPLGAGAVADHPLHVGAVARFECIATTKSSCTTVGVSAVVRNVRAIAADRWRLGLEFVDADLAATSALAELTILDPAHQRLAGDLDAPAVGDPYAEPIRPSRRAGARIAALMTTLCAVAVVLPLPSHPSTFGWSAMTTAVLSVSVLLAGGLAVGVRRPASGAHRSGSSPDLAMR